MDPKADILPLAVGGVGEERSERHERIVANVEKEARGPSVLVTERWGGTGEEGG